MISNQDRAEILAAKLSQIMPSGTLRARTMSTILHLGRHQASEAASAALEIFERRVAATGYHAEHRNYINENCLLCKR